ncbi:iron-sulfur cluster repair di-iron protein [Raineyella sp. LH-20]|nr:iron-sulfur cluster repair di-iron protein [Raineyella sp. LH-20]WOP17510.1 iron-sulfur cluster repair di-iron protein [Raineyella sp. LH-20]
MTATDLTPEPTPTTHDPGSTTHGRGSTIAGPSRRGPEPDRLTAAPIDLRATLAALVTADTRRARVLEDLGLDYCCHGDRTLTAAAAEAGLDLAEVADALALPAAPSTGEAPGSRPDAADTSLSTLAHDIVDTHHAYLWEEMPRLHALADKVTRVHGERHPELARVRSLFLTAEADLEAHLTREERVVFPAITRLERTGQAPATVQGPLDVLVAALIEEHDVVGDIVMELHTITDGYRTPEDGCGSYRALYDELAAMERDLHLHIHRENNVLFPATLERTAALAAQH